MTHHHSDDNGHGSAHQNQHRRRVSRETADGQHESALSPGDTADHPRLPEEKSNDVAAAQSCAAQPPGTDPLNVKITFVVVHGTATEELIKRQAAAVRDALEWFAHHPSDETDGERHDRTTA